MIAVPDEDLILAHKAGIRRQVLGERDDLSAIDRAVAANGVRTRILSLVLRTEAVVSGFLSMRSEIDITPALDDLVKAGRTVVLPVVVSKTELAFRQYTPGADLVDTGFGTRGPGDDAPVIDPTVLLVPLSAFDRSGGRLGYGAGLYDRTLARLDARGRVLAIGVGFSSQEREILPVGAHDRPLDYAVTERETIRCREPVG